MTFSVAAAGNFPGNSGGSARTPRRQCQHAPHEDHARFPLIFSLFGRARQCPTLRAQRSTESPRRAPVTPKGPNDARGSQLTR
eukprot:2433324-Pyramimonas_sp.AAC.1